MACGHCIIDQHKPVRHQWQIQGIVWFYLRAESCLEQLRVYEGKGQENPTFWNPSQPSLLLEILRPTPLQQFLEHTWQCSVFSFSRENPESLSSVRFSV